ncbi:cytochrome P450 [Xylariaceae sp. FL1272]|nr:cytochrome P450 [Xylariaceae sp. FL1272]
MQLLGLSALLALGYVIAICLYRAFLHPLAKVPGPFLSRISGLPAFHYTLKKDRHVWLWRLHQKYGPVVRVGPNYLVFNTPEAYQAIYGTKTVTRKGEYYKTFYPEPNAATTWTSLDKATHTRKRQVLSNTFSDKALRSAEPFIHSNVDRWCELLAQEVDGGKAWSKSLDMSHWITYLVFDILGDLCFGRCFDMKEPGSDLRYVPTLMMSFVEIMHPIAASPFVSIWVYLKPRGLDKLLAIIAPPTMKDWDTFVKKCLAERTRVEEASHHRGSESPSSLPTGRQDFFHYLFKAVDPHTGRPAYNKAELLNEAGDLIVAGGDTTSTALSAALFYLVRNPSVQSRLAAEITSMFSSFEEIGTNSRKLYACHYLRAFTQEVLRMSPPVPADLPREVQASPLYIDGVCIPPGTTVGTATYCLQHNDTYLDEPFTFNPERWIVDENDKTGSSEARVARAESCFSAYSAGSRGCIGKNLAYLEMYIVLAKFLYRFEMQEDGWNRIGGGSPDAIEGRRDVDQYQVYEMFVATRDGPAVQLRNRMRGA